MTDLVVSVHRANSAGRPRGAKAARRFVEALLAATALVAVTATSVVPAGASALDDSAEVEVQEPFLCTT